MSKTLWCEIGKHNFEHPGGRGRPPKNCPEHRPEKKAEVPDRFVSQNGVAGVEKVNPFIKKAQDKALAGRLKAGKEQKSEERSQAEQQQIEQEYLEIDAKIEWISRRYDNAFAKFNAAQTVEDIKKTGDALEGRQRELLNILRRKRYLESLVEQMTAPEPTLTAA